MEMFLYECDLNNILIHLLSLKIPHYDYQKGVGLLKLSLDTRYDKKMQTISQDDWEFLLSPSIFHTTSYNLQHSQT